MSWQFEAALKWLSFKFLDREMYIEGVIKCVRFCTMTLNEILACHSPPLLPGIVEMPEVELTLLKATCYVSAKSVNEQKRFVKYSCKPRVYLIERVPLILWDPNIFDPIRYAQYKKEMAATVIQAGFRGYTARLEVKRLKLERDSPEASKIQLEMMYSQGNSKEKVDNQGDSSTVIHDKVKSKISRQTKISGQTKMPGQDFWSTEQSLSKMHSSKEWTDLNQRTSDDIESMPLGARAEVYEQVAQKKSDATYLTDYIGDVYSKTGKLELDEGIENGRIIVLGGFDPRNPENDSLGETMVSYNPALDKWFEFGTMPVNRHHLCAVLFDKEIYIIGGSDLENTTSSSMVPSKTCFKFNLTSRKWSSIADMNECRIWHAAVVMQRNIFVVGGLNDANRVLDSIEYYIPDTNNWHFLTIHLSCPKTAIGVCVHEDQLWIAGGMVEDDDDECSNFSVIAEVEIYDPSQDKMLYDVAPLPGPRCYLTLTECQGIVYSIGGGTFLDPKDEKISSLSDVLCYDKELNFWVLATPLPSPRHCVSAVVFGGAIYVLGGLTTYFPCVISHEVIVYEPNIDIWSRCCYLHTSRDALSAVAVAGDSFSEVPHI